MRRLLTLLIATACAVGLVACAPAAATSEGPCQLADAPLTTLTLAEDPRAVTGGSTACLSSSGVDAVGDTTPPAVPVTLTDAEDREVTVADISRILPLDISGTIAATVFGLGLGDRVVGRDSSTTFTGTEQLPLVTASGHTLNAEAILTIAPTVVLTDTTIGPKEVRQQLRDAGIAVVVISSDRRIDNVSDIVGEVATALGVPRRGDALSERVADELDAVRAEVDEVAPAAASDRPRMLFLYVRGAANVYYIFGRDSGADSLIEAVGGVDVASEIGWEGMKPMTAEALVAAEPDVLVMMTDGLASVGGIDGLIERIPAVAQTPAGRAGRVIDMADGEILSFGPRTPEIVRSLARALYAPADSASSEQGPTPVATP